MKLEADLAGLANYIASVHGIIDAVESPGYQGDFLEELISDVESQFMVDTIANRHRLAHMFEWPDKQGQEPSPTPLFKIVRVGAGNVKTISFQFLPSLKSVPLPDPARYGFKASKLKFLRRHKFRLKALVMETQSAVTIKPKRSKHGLFIPDASAKRGYYMTKKPKVINPGGGQATGAFTEWWTAWFVTVGQKIASDRTKLAEETFAANGRKAIRDQTTGRFATGKKVSFGYSTNVRQRAMREFLALEKRNRR